MWFGFSFIGIMGDLSNVDSEDGFGFGVGFVVFN